jgi:hypothetical protein
MIVKLHKPLYSNEPNAPVLGYDQNRRYQVKMPMSSKLRALFGTKIKIFCTAHIAEDGSLAIDKIVPDRGW